VKKKGRRWDCCGGKKQEKWEEFLTLENNLQYKMQRGASYKGICKGIGSKKLRLPALIYSREFKLCYKNAYSPYCSP